MKRRLERALYFSRCIFRLLSLEIFSHLLIVNVVQFSEVIESCVTISNMANFTLEARIMNSEI